MNKKGHAEHVPDYDVTRVNVVEKIGASMPWRDGKVKFYKHAEKTE